MTWVIIDGSFCDDLQDKQADHCQAEGGQPNLCAHSHPLPPQPQSEQAK